jgi:hypothetical protein
MGTISIRNAKHAKTGLVDLINYIGDTSEMIMVEVGSYVGDSSEIFAKNFETVFCIDPWENGYDDNDKASSQYDMKIIEAQFDELRKKYKNIVKMRETSEKGAFHFLAGILNFVYIDGLHTYNGVKKDLHLWLPKVKKGFWIGGHDYNSKHFPGVKEAVNEFFIPDATFKDSSWIKRIA